MKVASWLQSLTDVFLPPTCAACDAVLSETQFVFCETCFAECTELRFPRCQWCAEPGSFAQGRCERCLRQRPHFDSLFAVFEYEGAVERAIHRLKYSDRSDLANPLGSLLAKGYQFAEEYRSLDVVVPVPLHADRFRERKYDHAGLLAHTVAQLLSIQLRTEDLVRITATPQQVSLNESARAENVKGAFAVRGDFRNLHVGLIDDVVTTGATVDEVAKILKQAGAASVNVLCIARQPRHH